MKLPVPEFSNPDQALIHRFLAAGGRPALGEADAQAGAVTWAFVPEPLFLQGAGVIQGGALTAMLDFAMAFATLAHMPIGSSCATVNLNTAFLRPAPRGHYLATGEVERRGRQLAFTHARLARAEDGQVVATGTSTLALQLPG